MKHLLTSSCVAIGALCLLSACGNKEQYYEKTVEFPADADSITKIDMAARLVPSPKQLAWQNLEMTAFLHFGVNTFTGREWGDGKEDENVFNPADLDTDQWVKTLKDAGFKMVILTAKHHDGFCLWPTATTDHSVKSSEWRNGQGDVVADLRASCDKYGMKLGLYLSPWDRNAQVYGSDAYNDMFVAQLTELLTQYGKIDEVWFDGACGEGPNGKKQVYDWARFKSTIETLQPDAVMAIMGDDVRWVGNERGMGRETEWSATPLTPGILPGAAASNEALGITGMSRDIGSRAMINKTNILHWWPSEVDVSIRPGWFFQPEQNPHSLRHLAEIYLNSVGRNSVLLLNIPPDRDGKIHDTDVKRLEELSQWINDNFSNDLVASAKDGVYTVKDGATINTVVLAEDITKGQRVEEFDVLGLVDGNWVPLTSGTTIGYKRILMFDPAEVEAVKVDVKSERRPANLKPIQLYMVEMPAATASSLAAGYKLVDRENWKAEGENAELALDGDNATLWTAPLGDDTAYVVDLGNNESVYGFVYTPATDQKANTLIYKYGFDVSNDGKNWKPCQVSGEFSNIVNNPIAQFVYLPQSTSARYVRLSAKEAADGGNTVGIGEFNVLTK